MIINISHTFDNFFSKKYLYSFFLPFKQKRPLPQLNEIPLIETRPFNCLYIYHITYCLFYPLLQIQWHLLAEPIITPITEITFIPKHLPTALSGFNRSFEKILINGSDMYKTITTLRQLCSIVTIPIIIYFFIMKCKYVQKPKNYISKG